MDEGPSWPLIREIGYGTEAYALMLRFREDELRRPLGLPLSADDTRGEERQRHFVAMVEDAASPRICAAVVMKPLPAEGGGERRAKLRQMAVGRSWHGRGLGRRLVRFAEAAMTEVAVIELNAREDAVGFYERLGYSVSGDGLTEVGLPHRPMLRHLRGGR